MSKSTEKLGLIKPELTDGADITMMNQNWDKIDNIISPLENTPADVTKVLTGETTLSNLIVGGANWSEYTNHLAIHDCTNKDFNTLKNPGFYFGYTGMTNAAFNEIGVLEVIPYSNDWVLQRHTRLTDGKMFMRYLSNGTTWSSWQEIYTSSNNYIPKMQSRSYTGTGVDGVDLVFYFDINPVIVFYGGGSATRMYVWNSSFDQFQNSESYRSVIIWGNKNVTINTKQGMNIAGEDYYCYAIGL